MDVVYSPYGSNANAYVNIVMDGLRRSGCDAHDLAWFYNRADKSPVPVFLNWEDEVKGRDKARVLWHYIQKRVRIFRILSKGGRIVYVVHNRAPHDTNGSLALKLSRRVRGVLAKESSCMVVLCDETKCDLKDQLGPVAYAAVEQKIIKIPIPSYTGCYPRSEKKWREEYAVEKDKFLFVFSGLIRPYKGVELIFDVADYFRTHKYNAEFLIVGRCDNVEYKEALTASLPEDSSVHLSFGFVKDDELGELIEASNALILPLDIRSSLNSSTCYLAFSYGRTLVCPLIGTLKEFDKDLFYSYEYRTSTEHKDKIIAAAEQAYLDWKKDSHAFASKGQRLKSIVDTECNVETIGAMYRAAAEKSLE